MIELLTFWLAGFCTGVAFTGGLAGWFRRRMGPPKGSYGIRLDEGPVQRGNGSGGPTTPKPDIVPKPQYPGGYISLDGAQPFRVRGRLQPLPDELDAYTYQRGPQGDTPNPPPSDRRD